MDELCIDQDIQSLKLAITSSGFSGLFSYGMNTAQDSNSVTEAIDTMLDFLFKTSEKRIVFTYKHT